MALIVEDGTIVAGAESYISVANADSYHDKRGNSAWDAVADKEAMLRRATDYMVQNYRASWKGVRVSANQALDWPRSAVYLQGTSIYPETALSSSVVPLEIQNACAELALRAAAEDLNPDLDRAVVSETVGPISTTYDAHSAQKKRFLAVDAMLRPYLKSSGPCADVVRT